MGREEKDLHYNYDLQCWVAYGRVKKCGHREFVALCYACSHGGEDVEKEDEDP